MPSGQNEPLISQTIDSIFEDPGPDLGDIIRLNNQYHDSAVLHFAHRLGLFERLEKAATAEQIAALHGWREHKTAILLDALVAYGFLTKDDGGSYRNKPNISRFLTSRSADYIGGVVDHQRLQWPVWTMIETVLNNDADYAFYQERRLASDAEANAAFNETVKFFSRDHIADVLSQLEIAEASRVIDICGGHGTYLAIIARDHPKVTGEVWDMAHNEHVALQVFRDYMVSDRLVFKTKNVGDPAAFEGEQPADLCFLNDCLHYFDRGTVGALVGDAASLVAPGGRLVVTTMTLEQNRVEPAAAARFSLHMMMNTSAGELHPTDWLAELMRDAGLVVRRVQIGSLKQYSMLSGLRPAG